MGEQKKEFGKHYIVEFIECANKEIRFVDELKEVFLKSAEVSQATVLEHHFHQFDPEGVTAMIFIAESHFSIHTWPEDGYVAFDILTCGPMDAQKAIDCLKEFLKPSQTEVKIISRGY